MRARILLRLFLPTLGFVIALSSFSRSSSAQKVDPALPLLWSEDQRAFLQDGPGLLLTQAQVDQLVALDDPGREAFIRDFLARDPIPETPENELALAIEKRLALVRAEFFSVQDDRAKLLFLRGAPRERTLIECTETFKPLELWTYEAPESTSRWLVLYRPKPELPYKLWLPIDSKRELYNPEMEYWLNQWEELKGRITGGRRFDREICKESKLIDQVTGVDGLFGFAPDRPKNSDFELYLAPPADLAAWVRAAAQTALPESQSLGESELEISFPEKAGLRMLTRLMVILPAGLETQPVVEGEKSELRFVVEGQLERAGKVFESFRMRFQLPVPETRVPLALAVDRRLRPGEEFLVRLKVEEESSRRHLFLNRGFIVASEPTSAEEVPIPEEAIIALGEELKRSRVAGHDSLILVPPETDVVFGLWRAEALVTGERIVEVAFLLDGQRVMSRRRPPFTAELRLDTYPREQVVRAEGFDEKGELVSADEVVVNQPRGELKVRILEPDRGTTPVGETLAKAEIVVPEEKYVRKVTFSVNEQLQATLERPPWEAKIQVPPSGGELVYLTVAAELDDGTRAEDVRFLNAVGGNDTFLEEVDVNLVELYTTVTDSSGRLVRGLVREDFKVWEDGRPQRLVKFELVENLPLTLGIVIDTSGSMFESLAEAQRSAVGFLDNVITQQDRAFAVAFSDRPVLLMPRTSDVGAIAERLESLVASGATALHDAVVTSLYYYRGVRGRRALVLLSDGEDTSSTVGFREALEYAKRSGVAIYTIGLNIGRTDIGVRRKLESLTEETGGRSFYIRQAAELAEVYEQIEQELRSQYLAAYNSDAPGKTGQYREVTVEVKGGKLKARTMRGYYD